MGRLAYLFRNPQFWKDLHDHIDYICGTPEEQKRILERRHQEEVQLEKDIAEFFKEQS